MNRTIDIASFRQTCFCLLVVCCFTVSAYCQDDDPFGSSGAIMDATDSFSPAATAAPEPTAAGNARSSNVSSDPLVKRVRELPPKTPTEMAKAITWMVHLRSWETVGSLLERMASANWALESKAQLAREISPETWSQLHRFSSNLDEKQNKLLKALHSAPGEYSRDPKVIESWIDQLASPSNSQRQLAQLRLQDGQRIALGQLLDRLLGGDTRVPARTLAETIVKFDRDGIEALRAACNLSDSTRSSRVILSLADISDKQFSSELAAALYSGRYTAEVKQAIASKIQARYAKLPSQAVAKEFLQRDLNEALEKYQLQRTNPTWLTTSVWQPTADAKVVARDVTSDLAALERLAQLGCMLSQLESVEPSVDELSAVIQLQRAYQLTPTLIDSAYASQLIQPFPVERAAEADFWVAVFRKASSLQMHGAAIRSLQLLNAQIQAGKLPPIDFLGELLSDGRPVVRYLGLELIASADPRTGFAASDRAIATAIEMTQMTQGPQALIIGGNGELCMAAEQMVQAHTGSKSAIASSARSAVRNLVGQTPIEMILVVDRVHDMSLFELLQRLRNSGSLPIAILVERLHQHELDFVEKSAGFHVSNLSRDPDHLKQVLDQLTRTLDVRPMTTDDRIRFAALAGGFLTKIAADRNTYSFYPFAQWNEQLINNPAIVQPQAQAKVLASLGSRESQRLLTQLAIREGVSEQDRLSAARSFEESVRRFGMQLSDEDVKSSYENYNRYGPADPVIAKAMGYVLDIIEAQSGTRLWPDPL